jgi:hypothetical protein
LRTGFDSENEEPLRGGGIRASEISLTNLYPNRYAFSIKNEDSETGDTLRVSVFCQNCRYAKKTQLSLDPKKYRYVGEITSFRTAKKPLLQCSYLKLDYKKPSYLIWKRQSH